MAKFHAFAGRQTFRGSKANAVSAKASMAGVIRNYQKVVNNLEGVTPEVLYEALEPTFAKSQVYCPKDTGKLVKSGYLEIVSFRGKPRVEMGYGKNGEPDYAAAVHENLEWRHKSPTRAKWLQAALGEDRIAIQNRIIAGLKRRGGFGA